MDSTIYSEIRILIDILFGNILGNHLIGDIPRTAAKISSCPQVPSPELFLQMRILRQQMVCCLPFQPLQQAADRHLRWDRYEEMYMVLGHMPFMIWPSCCPHISRIKSRTRLATSPLSAGRRYFVIHTTCRWISKTVCAPCR